MGLYLNDRDLYYEIVLSKGKGKLTKRAEHMLMLIAENFIRKFDKLYKSKDDKMDCFQQCLLHLFSNWKSFNDKKYCNSLPFFTEVCKRGLADGNNLIKNKKSYNKENYSVISLDSSADGKGLYNLI